MGVDVVTRQGTAALQQRQMEPQEQAGQERSQGETQQKHTPLLSISIESAATAASGDT